MTKRFQNFRLSEALVLGGSFNPPHAGHLHIAKTALKRTSIKQVIVMPAKQNPFKKHITNQSFDVRFEKCKDLFLTSTCKKYQIFLSDFENFSNDFETFFVLSNFCKQNPSIRTSWLMGLDCVSKFFKWGCFSNFVNLFPIVIVSRGSCKQKINYLNSTTVKILKNRICYNPRYYNQKSILFIDGRNVDISSTKIRESRQ